MNISMKGVAKRLIFSLLVASALGGCAVYEPASSVPYTYANGRPVTVVPHVVTEPYYPYSPYYYDPLYVGPPVYFNFGIRSYGGHRFHGHRYGGHRFHGRGAGSGRRGHR